VTVLYTVSLLNTARSVLRKSLHVGEISSRSSAYIKTPTRMPATWQPRPEAESLHIISINYQHIISITYNIINTQLWERVSARALQTIRTVGFLQKLSTIDDVTKYHGIPVSRYFEMVYYDRAFPSTAHPYFQPAEDRRLSWPAWLVIYPRMVGHLSTNLARRGVG